jgi:NAD(P)-dependent dehydrogenase (short-subunit alcohol dehydrogenase family)
MIISNKTVLITGANRGIGRALVDEALRRGAKCVHAGTHSAALNAADERVAPLALDVTDTAQIQQAVEQVGALDVLINNAGVAIYDDPSNLHTIEQQLTVNLFGIVKVTRAFLPLLKRSKGAIINNLSLAALAPLPVIPGYSMSKAAALRGFMASGTFRTRSTCSKPLSNDAPTTST